MIVFKTFLYWIQRTLSLILEEMSFSSSVQDMVRVTRPFEGVNLTYRYGRGGEEVVPHWCKTIRQLFLVVPHW